jgi:hypothetical protein
MTFVDVEIALVCSFSDTSSRTKFPGQTSRMVLNVSMPPPTGTMRLSNGSDGRLRSDMGELRIISAPSMAGVPDIAVVHPSRGNCQDKFPVDPPPALLSWSKRSTCLLRRDSCVPDMYLARKTACHRWLCAKSDRIPVSGENPKHKVSCSGNPWDSCQTFTQCAEPSDKRTLSWLQTTQLDFIQWIFSTGLRTVKVVMSFFSLLSTMYTESRDTPVSVKGL